MEKDQKTYETTAERIWAILQENAIQLKAFRENQKENAAENDRRMQEAERRMQENAADAERRMQEAERRMQENAAEAERRMQENDRFLKEMSAKTDKEIQKVNQTLGAWATNQGEFAEEYFFNAFEQGETNFFGEKFDEIKKNFKGAVKGIEDEYDIVLINGKTIGIIEVKSKAHKKDIPTVLRKAETFKILFPYYKDFKIYLGLASMSFYKELEEECINHGIAIIKQVGDAVVINDKHLRVY